MDKRLLIVLPLCLVIVIGWQLLTAKNRPPVPRPPVESTATTPAAPTAANDKLAQAPKPAAAPISAVQRAEQEETRVLQFGEPGKPGCYRAVFTNRGGALKELALGDFFDKPDLDAAAKADPAHWTRVLMEVETPKGLTSSFLLRSSVSSADLVAQPLEEELWMMHVLGSEEHPTGVEFRLAPGTGVVFVKRFTFLPGEHQLRFELELENVGRDEASKAVQFVLTPAACVPTEAKDQYYAEPQAVACARELDSEELKVSAVPRDERGTKTEDSIGIGRKPLSFAGVENKYFAALLRGENPQAAASMIGASWRGLRDERWVREHPAEAQLAWKQIVTDVQLEVALPAKGEKSSTAFVLYAGPKERAGLAAAHPDFALLTRSDLGFFAAIASVLLLVLGFLHSIAFNWGVAIILLTVLVRGVLFPINRRSQTAMARYQSKMKRVQPKIDELKKRYADDKAKLNQEQAKLLQAEGAFPPLGGCLPMFLQIPVFFGLFAALRAAFDLRQAPFLWISDLSRPDHTIHVGWNYIVPLVGWDMHYINILPPIMIGMWIWQQRGMPMPADEQAAKMQKMMMWMPVLTGVFLYNYAAGLSLYMITQSGLGVFEQKFIKKHWPPDDKEQPGKKKKGWMARMMEKASDAQREAEALKRRRNEGRR